jgi:uncharacterized membrane protein (DUF2068 family)
MTWTLAATYALLGLLGLAPLVFVAMAWSLSTSFPPVALVLVSPAVLNVLACWTIAYGLWSLKNWSRWLALAYNAFWILAFTVGSVVSRSLESNPPELTTTALIFIFGIVIFFGGLTALLLRPNLFRNERIS